jgi:cytochrome c oxidase subunit 2
MVHPRSWKRFAWSRGRAHVTRTRTLRAHPVRTRISGARLAWAGFLALALSSCSVLHIDSPLSIFDVKGPFARRIDGLFWPVFWVATVVFVLVQGLILFTVIRFRDTPKRKEPKQVHGNAVLEITWTVIPTLILATLAVPTVRAVFDLTECGSGAMPVNITAHQWWFEYDYPELGITTANVLVMPAGKEICANMTSADVIHNFWVPNLNGKRYLVPGQYTSLRLQADAPGEFWGHCAEFCGLSHSLMRARVLALSESDWQAWITAQKQPAKVPAEGTPEYAGLQVYLAKGCTACHAVDFEDGKGVDDVVREPGTFRGPNLTHFASRDAFAGASLPYEGLTHDEALTLWLQNPPKMKPGSFMPNLGLTAQEIQDVIAWLDSNK